jgi:hypothetical protein
MREAYTEWMWPKEDAGNQTCHEFHTPKFHARGGIIYGENNAGKALFSPVI